MKKTFIAALAATTALCASAYTEETETMTVQLKDGAQVEYNVADTEDYKTYHFEIKLVDDIGFEVRGEWNKPLEYLYDAENLDKELSGITTPTGAADVKVVLEGRNIVVLNGGNAAITLYDLNGRTVATGNAAEVLDASAFGAGIYVLTINNQSIKIALK